MTTLRHWEGCLTNLKGKLGNFFLLAQSFYWPQTKRSLNRQFSPKSPKVGKKSGQSVKKWPNKTPLASDLLWESTKSVIGAAVGIHQIWHRSCCGNPLFGNFSIRPTVGIHQICHRSCCGNPSIPSSELLWESMRVYNSIRWMYFNNDNYSLRTSSHPPLSFYIPCSFHLPQDTVLEFWPLEKRGCVKCELLSNGMGIGIII